MDRHGRGEWGSVFLGLGVSVLIGRLWGRSWDQICRMHLAAGVIIIAVPLAVMVLADVWLALYNLLGPTGVMVLFVGGLALWALRQHVQHRGP